MGSPLATGEVLYAQSRYLEHPVRLGEYVDAVVETASDGSQTLIVGQGLIDILHGLQLGSVARSCMLCGCRDDVACLGGCWWVTSELCSSCAPVALVPS